MDTLVLLTVGIITLTLMVMGHLTNKRVFNVFSTVGFVALAIELSDYIALIILFVGIIIYELYYAFFANIER
jgi:hypothetical protein